MGFTPAEVIELARDCAENGVRFLSLGGGEPLEWPGLFEVLDSLRGVLFRSFTTNGLQLAKHLDEVVRVAPDKVHVSIHVPSEAERVSGQVSQLSQRGVPSGVNLLVRRSQLEAAREAALTLERAGIQREQVVFLPSRGIPNETPTPADVAWVATGQRVKSAPFKSMSCLNGCAKSERFLSIGADRTVAWCSYTISRRPLLGLKHVHVLEALGLTLTPSLSRREREVLGLIPCDQARLPSVGARG